MDPKEENLINTSSTELVRKVDDGIPIVRNIPFLGPHFSRLRKVYY